MNIPKDNPNITSFTDLHAWQEGHKLVLMVYSETSKLPSSERFNLINQLQRAVVSITSNIAEGYARNNPKERVQFFYISLGSIKEVQNQLLICKDLGYISNDQFQLLANQSKLVNKLTYGYIKSITR